MCSLATFQPPPPEGFISICERNGELQAVHAKDGASMQSMDYPHVNVSADLLKPCVSKETARSAFLEPDDTMRQRLLRAWYEHGLSGILEELAQEDEKEKALWISRLAGKVLAVVRYTSALHGSLFPHLAMSNEDLIAEFATNFTWKESPVRCFAWHPHTNKFALALRDDSIRVYTNKKTDIVPILKHKLQKGVADLTWKPMSASVLAVACQSCILIWHVDPMSLATRPSTSSVQVLSQPGHSPVTSIAWCPKGGILISASPTDTAMMVWDVAMEVCEPLRRVGGGGVSFIRWSPDGSKIMAACPSPLFRVWECCKWSCEKWTKLLSRCKTACWSPDGSILLFAVASEPIIYSLTFTQPLGNEPVIGGSKVAVNCVDLSEVEIVTEDGPVRVGGLVQNMVWDPNGERLAVQLKGGSCELIALFQTRLHPMLEVMPWFDCEVEPVLKIISLKRPHVVWKVVAIDRFDCKKNQVWSNGRLTFLPLYYLAQRAVEERRFLDQRSMNGSLQTMPLFTSP